MARKLLLSAEDGMQALRETDGRIFYAEFIKKDGTLRRMTARVGVSKGVNGKGMKYDPVKRGLVPVYDMDKDAWRMINTGTLCRLHTGGMQYTVETDPDVVWIGPKGSGIFGVRSKGVLSA